MLDVLAEEAFLTFISKQVSIILQYVVDKKLQIIHQW
jgi:hypothetical protein